MRVKDVMSHDVIGVSPFATVAEALDIMRRARVSGLPVIDEAGTLVGIISEADFLRRSELGTEKPGGHWLVSFFRPGHSAEVYARAHGRLVQDIMTTDVAVLTADADLEEAVTLMERRHVKRLPVTAGGKVIGMITRADFIAALALFLRKSHDQSMVADSAIRRNIEAEMQRQPWAPVASTSIEIADGVVTLSGVLTDERERRAIHALVENVEGVRNIVDHMIWAEPLSGFTEPSPEDAAREDAA